MYWTLELASYLSDAPWPMTKAELIDYAIRTGAPMEVVENLQAIEDEGEIYEHRGSMERLSYGRRLPLERRRILKLNTIVKLAALRL